MSKYSLEWTNIYIFVYQGLIKSSFYIKHENLKIFADKITEKICHDPQTFKQKTLSLGPGNGRECHICRNTLSCRHKMVLDIIKNILFLNIQQHFRYNVYLFFASTLQFFLSISQIAIPNYLLAPSFFYSKPLSSLTIKYATP